MIDYREADGLVLSLKRIEKLPLRSLQDLLKNFISGKWSQEAANAKLLTIGQQVDCKLLWITREIDTIRKEE